MDKIKQIATICEYGKITVNLKSLMDEKGLSRYQLAKITNTRFEVVNKWYSGEVERIDSDVLARFCYTLNCKVEDILKYTP